MCRVTVPVIHAGVTFTRRGRTAPGVYRQLPRAGRVPGWAVPGLYGGDVARRGNRVGAARLLTRAAERIEPYSTRAPHAVPVAELAVWARMLAERIRREDADVPADALTPRMTR